MVMKETDKKRLEVEVSREDVTSAIGGHFVE
jgi:hypothetical protein